MRMRISSRYVPKDAEPIAREDLGAVVYLYGPCGAIGYSGRRNRPDFHFSFRSDEQRRRHLAEYFERLAAAEASKQARQKERTAFAHSLKTGDILYGSWGYEQTNVDFYQVVEVVSAKSVRLRPIAQTRTEDSWCAGTTLPVPDRFTGEAATKRVGIGNRVAMGFRGAGPWHGRPVRWSSYA